jgi:hypothetical protein
MKNQRLLVALTVVNLGLLTYQLVRPRFAFAQETGPILRGRALEIVDERGKVRAELRVSRLTRSTSCRTAIPTPRRCSSA